jgi:hypothetical protein
MNAPTRRVNLPLSAAALAAKCRALDRVHVAPPMAQKKGGLRKLSSPSRKRQNEDVTRVPLPRLAGYVEFRQGGTEPVQFRGIEVSTEGGLGAPVVTVASVGTGPKRGGASMAAGGSLIYVIMIGDCVF